jgi:hypothetical protein
LSTEDDDLAEPTGGPAGRFHLVLRVLALLASAASLVALWMGERRQAHDDLQLVVESAARPGEVLALRALLLRHVDAPEGPALAQAPVEVRLLDGAERELARTQLLPSAFESMEGALAVPANVRGRLYVEARVAGSDPALSCRRILDVAPSQPAAAPVDRIAGRLQQLVLGRVYRVAGAMPPTPFAPRVVGGSCAPEEPCRLLVWVGEPAASIRARANPAVDVLSAPQPETETVGLVLLELRLHGAEAEVTLEARRSGEVVAERALRLPVALGEPGLALAKPFLDSAERPMLTLSAPPGRSALIVDGYANQRWTFTRTFDAGAPLSALTLSDMPSLSGIFRIQARADLFSADTASTRVGYARAPSESEQTALANMVHATGELRDEASAHLDANALALATQDIQRWTSFLLAPLELARMRVPIAASGRARAMARLSHARTFLRFGVGAMLVLGALIVGGTLLRRGLDAAQEADKIMDDALDVRERTKGAHLRERIRIVLWVLAVGMAFVAAALLIVAKPLWF